MASNSTEKPHNLLSLIDECTELELNANLDILQTDLACSDNKVGWLPILHKQLQEFNDVSVLNLHDKIRMLVEVRKILPKVTKLQNDLTEDIGSIKNVCSKHQFDFETSLSQNLQEHRSCGKLYYRFITFVFNRNIFRRRRSFRSSTGNRRWSYISPRFN